MITPCSPVKPRLRQTSKNPSISLPAPAAPPITADDTPLATPFADLDRLFPSAGAVAAADPDEIGRLGAIAVIRTFLNYFLERDLAELEQREAASGDAAGKTS
jgi:hypothetical protein